MGGGALLRNAVSPQQQNQLREGGPRLRGPPAALCSDSALGQHARGLRTELTAGASHTAVLGGLHWGMPVVG